MTRITRKQARKIYKAGLGVIFCPSKCSPHSKFAVRMYKKDSDESFDYLVALFWYHHCSDETGKSVYFYI